MKALITGASSGLGYLFDTFVVFRGSMDTNDLAKKEEPIK